MVDERKKRLITFLLMINKDFKKKGKVMLSAKQERIFKKSINPKTEHTVLFAPQYLDVLENIIKEYICEKKESESKL